MLRKGISSPTDSSIHSAGREFPNGFSSISLTHGIRTSIARTARALRAMKNSIRVAALVIADSWNNFWFGEMTYEDHQLVTFWEKLGKEVRNERNSRPE